MKTSDLVRIVIVKAPREIRDKFKILALEKKTTLSALGLSLITNYVSKNERKK